MVNECLTHLSFEWQVWNTVSDNFYNLKNHILYDSWQSLTEVKTVKLKSDNPPGTSVVNRLKRSWNPAKKLKLLLYL